jgi:methylation protein EvaC
MTCASCGSRLTKVMDFGRMAHAGAFLKPDDFATEQRHELTLQFCEACLLVQVGERAPDVFGNYFTHSSATETMRRHFCLYAKQMVERFHPGRALEIGCNDGVLMKPLQALGVDVVGVDPAKNLTPPGVVNARWGTEVARSLGSFDLILANNVMAHIPDANDAFAAVALALTERGSFVFEVNRLDSMIYDLQYDWVYHEHLYYYSLIALDGLLKRHGLKVYDLQRIGTHAGSIRYFVCKDDRPETNAVQRQRDTERWMSLDRAERFHRFALDAAGHRKQMRELVHSHDSVAGYGACGRTNTMLQFCGFDSSDIAYIVDDAPAKHGYYTPGTHIQVVPAITGQPDLLIIFAWSFLNEIQPKLASYHGKVVVPLPHIYERAERAAA